MTRMMLMPVFAVLVISGCDAERSRIDTIALDDDQAHAVFIQGRNMGPDAPLVVMLEEEPIRAAPGCLMITGGRRPYIVQPSAFRLKTGMAMSVEQAKRILAQAELQRKLFEDVASATDGLVDYLQGAKEKSQAERASLQTNAAASDAEAQRLLVLSTGERAKYLAEVETNSKRIADLSKQVSEAAVIRAENGQVSMDDLRKRIADLDNQLAQSQEMSNKLQAALAEREHELDTVSKAQDVVVSDLQKAQINERQLMNDLRAALERERKLSNDAAVSTGDRDSSRAQVIDLASKADEAAAFSAKLAQENDRLAGELVKSRQEASNARLELDRILNQSNLMSAERRKSAETITAVDKCKVAQERWKKVAAKYAVDSPERKAAISELKALALEQRQVAPGIAVDSEVMKLIGE